MEGFLGPQPGCEGNKDDGPGNEECVFVTVLLHHPADNQGPENGAAVAGHLEGRQGFPTIPVGANDVGEGGLDGWVAETCPEAGAGGEHNEHPEAMGEPETSGEDHRHEKPTINGGFAPNGVGNAPGELQGDGVAHGVGREHVAGNSPAIGEGGLDEKRDHGDPHPKIHPPVGERGHDNGPIGGVAKRLQDSQFQPGVLGLCHTATNVFGHGQPHDEGSQGQKQPIDEEWPAEPQDREERPQGGAEDGAEEEPGGIGAGAAAPDGGRGKPHDEPHGGYGKHGGPKPGKSPKEHKMPILLSGGNEPGGDGNNEQTGDIHPAGTEFVDKFATGGGEHEPGEAERGDDGAGCNRTDTEAGGKLREDGGNESIA